MQPVRLRVTKIIDFGTIVSIIGIDTQSRESVIIHVDHRPFAAVWEAWRAAGFPEPVEFDADKLTLKLDINPDEQEERPTAADERREDATA
jgi:hypothetical protein